MTRTLQMTAEIPESREVTIRLPLDVPTGSAQLVVEVTSEVERLETLRDIEDARRALKEAKKEGSISLAQMKTELGL